MSGRHAVDRLRCLEPCVTAVMPHSEQRSVAQHVGSMMVGGVVPGHAREQVPGDLETLAPQLRLRGRRQMLGFLDRCRPVALTGALRVDGERRLVIALALREKRHRELQGFVLLRHPSPVRRLVLRSGGPGRARCRVDME